MLELTAPCGADGDGLGLRLIRLLLGNLLRLDHACEGGVALARRLFHGAERVVGIRSADDAGEERGFGKGELGRVFLKIDPRGLPDALDLAPPVDLVDVGLEDAILVQRGIDAECDGDLQAFAVELQHQQLGSVFLVFIELLARLELEYVGCELLGDGRCPLLFSREVCKGCPGDADQINRPVRIEAFVLPCEDGLAEIFGNILERDDLAFLAVDTPDLGALAVQDDGPLGHLVDAVEIIGGGADPVDDREHGEQVKAGDGWRPEEPGKEAPQRREATGECEQQVERPEEQQRQGAG